MFINKKVVLQFTREFTRVAMFDCLGYDEKYSNQYRRTINCCLFLSLSVTISGNVGFTQGLTRKC